MTERRVSKGGARRLALSSWKEASAIESKPFAIGGHQAAARSRFSVETGLSAFTPMSGLQSRFAVIPRGLAMLPIEPRWHYQMGRSMIDNRGPALRTLGIACR